MAKKKHKKPVPKPAEALSDKELDSVAGGLAGPSLAVSNIGESLLNKQREVLSSLVGGGMPGETKFLKQ